MNAYLWAILATLTWGIVPLIEKMGLAKIPVYQSLFFRFAGLFFGLFCLVVFKFSEIKQAIVKVPDGWYYLAIGGFLASFVGQIFFYNALKTGEVSKITPIVGAFPIVSFILGVIILGEAITVPKIIGLMFVVAGVGLLR